MYINNLRLYARHLRRDLAGSRDGLPEPARARFLLQGPNGSGKSTILEAIATLWDFFGEWIDVGPDGTPPNECLQHYFAHSEFAAVELCELTPHEPPLWIAMGQARHWAELKLAHPEAIFAGLIRDSAGGHWRIELPPRDWKSFRERSLAGVEPQANIVYAGSESHLLSESMNGRRRPPDLTQVRWLASVPADMDLETLLIATRSSSPKAFAEALNLINMSPPSAKGGFRGTCPRQASALSN